MTKSLRRNRYLENRNPSESHTHATKYGSTFHRPGSKNLFRQYRCIASRALVPPNWMASQLLRKPLGCLERRADTLFINTYSSCASYERPTLMRFSGRV